MIYFENLFYCIATTAIDYIWVVGWKHKELVAVVKSK